MTNNKHKENWKKEYCDRFGLCTDNGKHATCQCSKELRFIKELLSSALTEQLEEIERWVEENNKKIGDNDVIYTAELAFYLHSKKEIIKKQ